jgi:type I restriction enzyme S subunit
MSDTEPTSNNPEDGQLPEGWKVRELRDLVDVLDSIRKPINSKERASREGQVPYYGAAGQVGTIDVALFNEDLVLLGEDGVQFFDVDKPKAYEISGPSWVNNHAHVLRCRSEAYKQRLLVHYLNQFDYRNRANGTTRLKLTQAAMNGIPVLTPPLAEQEQIVEILEEQLSRLDAALESVRVVREKAAQFRRSLLHAAFTGTLTGHNPSDGQLPEGWNSYSLGEIESLKWIKLGRGKVISKRDIAANPGDYPIYSSAGLNGGEFGRYGEFLFDEELITWSVDGGGHLFYRPKHRFSVTNVGGWIRILDFQVFDYKYLYFALTYAHSQTVFDWSRKAHPSVIRLAYDSVPIPTRAEQERIVEILEEQLSRLDAALAVADAIEKRSAALRRSLLHAAFTGRLTEQWRESVHV